MPKSVLVYVWARTTQGNSDTDVDRNQFWFRIRPKQPETNLDFVTDTKTCLGWFQANAALQRFRDCCGHICWAISRPTLHRWYFRNFRSTLPRTMFDTDVELCVGLCFGRSNPKHISTMMCQHLCWTMSRPKHRKTDFDTDVEICLDYVAAETKLFEAQAAQNRFRPCVNIESQSPCVANLCSPNRRTWSDMAAILIRDSV